MLKYANKMIKHANDILAHAGNILAMCLIKLKCEQFAKTCKQCVTNANNLFFFFLAFALHAQPQNSILFSQV